MTNVLKKSDYMKIRNDQFAVVTFENDGNRKTISGLGILDAVKYMIAKETAGEKCFIIPISEHDRYDSSFGVFSDGPKGQKEVVEYLKNRETLKNINDVTTYG